MQRPDDNYLRSLVVTGLDDQEIRHVATLDGLAPVGLDHLTKLRVGLADAPRNIDPGTRDDLRWLYERGIEGLFNGTRPAREAIDLLRDRARRRPVEALLLGGLDYRSILGFLQQRGLAVPSEDALKAFRHYFWNVDTGDHEELREFLAQHPLAEQFVRILEEGPAAALDVATKLVRRPAKPVPAVVSRDPRADQRMSRLFESAAAAVPEPMPEPSPVGT